MDTEQAILLLFLIEAFPQLWLTGLGRYSNENKQFWRLIGEMLTPKLGGMDTWEAYRDLRVARADHRARGIPFELDEHMAFLDLVESDDEHDTASITSSLPSLPSSPPASPQENFIEEDEADC